MLSEGRPGLDELYSLRDGTQNSYSYWVPIGFFVMIVRGESQHGVGILRLEVSKALYERSGLNGKPIPDGGRKHLKTRYGQ